jgi:hypothetical protein
MAIANSGIGFRPDRGWVYVVTEGLELRILDRDGVTVRPTIGLPSSHFTTPVSITYMGSDRFAVLDANPHIILFHLTYTATEVDVEQDLKSIPLNDIGSSPGGGVNGIAYDPVDDVFYVGTESTGDDLGGLWEVDPKNPNTDGEATQTLLFHWYESVIESNHVGSNATFEDVYFSRDLAGGLVNDSVFCLFAGIKSDQRRVSQLNKSTGSHISSIDYGPLINMRGLVFDTDFEDMYLVGGASADVYKFEHDGLVEETTFDRQFFVKDLPTKSDPNRFGREVTFSINILPNLSDEFFLQHEYDGSLDAGPIPNSAVVDSSLRRANRWANTLRNWGGAATCEVFLDSVLDPPIIAEQDIGDIHGYHWDSPTYGTHSLTIRLRASEGSAEYVDLVGYFRIMQIECPEE